MYAIVETGGKQVKVSVGDRIFVEKLNVEAGQEVKLDKVLFVGGEKAIVGKPCQRCRRRCQSRKTRLS